MTTNPVSDTLILSLQVREYKNPVDQQKHICWKVLSASEFDVQLSLTIFPQEGATLNFAVPEGFATALVKSRRHGWLSYPCLFLLRALMCFVRSHVRCLQRDVLVGPAAVGPQQERVGHVQVRVELAAHPVWQCAGRTPASPSRSRQCAQASCYHYDNHVHGNKHNHGAAAD